MFIPDIDIIGAFRFKLTLGRIFATFPKDFLRDKEKGSEEMKDVKEKSESKDLDIEGR
jgi:hypothetical protein